MAAGYGAAPMAGWRLEHNQEALGEVSRLKTVLTEVTIVPPAAALPAEAVPLSISKNEATAILGELARSRSTISNARVAALKLIGLWQKWEDSNPKLGLIINLGSSERDL